MESTSHVPTAEGSLAKTPLPHLLVYAYERQLTGSFEFREGAEITAALTVLGGLPAKIRTAESPEYLGTLMLELGQISEDQLAASLERLRDSPRLQGEILAQLGVSAAEIERGLAVQLERKVESLFAMSPHTTFAYFDGIDLLDRYGGPPTPRDPFPIIWRGIRKAPSWDTMRDALARLGSAAIRIASHAQMERFGFLETELDAVGALRTQPLRVAEWVDGSPLSQPHTEMLAYCLTITKQIELVDAGSAVPDSSTSRALREAEQGPGSQSPASSRQAFARVQLQPRQVQRTPMVVQEVAPVRRTGDERVASSAPPPPAEGAPSGWTREASRAEANAPSETSGIDLGAVIAQTMANDPAAGATQENARAEAARSGLPPAKECVVDTSSLTTEERTLLASIQDRAANIASQNYFQMLGVVEDASVEQVQRAFFALAKVWHPDRLPPALQGAKEACGRVFTQLTEAHSALVDPEKRREYMPLLRDGGATPDDQAKIHAVLEAASDFQKAEVHLKRGDHGQAYAMANRACTLDPEQADYLAMRTWLEAQRASSTGREATLEKINILGQCIQRKPTCERAYFWRGMLYKKIDETRKAAADFKQAAELNPRNLDAQREIRLYKMRGGTGGSRPPSSRGSKPSGPESLSDLFGKLFKK